MTGPEPASCCAYSPGVSGPRVSPWSEVPGQLSEGPRWHEERSELLWVDIIGSKFHRASLGPEDELIELATVVIDRHVGAVAPVHGGGYVLAAGTGFLFVDETGHVHDLAQPVSGRTDIRMNDGACDLLGRFWAGSMAYDESPGMGTLYRLELDGTCAVVMDGLTISNGIGWSPDWSIMFLADSGSKSIEAFDFDLESGELTNPRTIVHLEEPGIAPDGLTVDDEGGIWVAIWGAGVINRYDADGTLLLTIQLPVDYPTSCAFAGRDLKTLFVTTARSQSGDASGDCQPDAGRVFRIDGLPFRGVPCLPYRGNVNTR